MSVDLLHSEMGDPDEVFPREPVVKAIKLDSSAAFDIEESPHPPQTPSTGKSQVAFGGSMEAEHRVESEWAGPSIELAPVPRTGSSGQTKGRPMENEKKHPRGPRQNPAHPWEEPVIEDKDLPLVEPIMYFVIIVVFVPWILHAFGVGL